MKRWLESLVPIAVIGLAGCATASSQGAGSATPASAITASSWKGPVVEYDAAALGSDRAAACEDVKARLVPPDRYSAAAGDAGMLPDDFEAFRETAASLHVAVTFRDSNKACAPHLREGMESKGHDVLTKTFPLESLPPGFEYLAGTVSILEKKPKAGEVIADPLSKRYLTREGQPLTCDYDLMDMVEADGARVTGQTPRDLQVRQALNAALPLRGEPAHHVDRVKHGAQAEYPNYLRTQERAGHHEPPVTILFAPDSPITLLDQQGQVYRLATVEDALNYYRCVGAGTPPEWNLQAHVVPAK